MLKIYVNTQHFMPLAKEARGPISMWQIDACAFKLQTQQLKAIKIYKMGPLNIQQDKQHPARKKNHHKISRSRLSNRK